MRLVHTAALLLLLGVGVAAIPVPSSSSKKDGDATNPHANDPWSWYSRGLAGWKAGEKTADLLDGTSWKVPARRKAVVFIPPFSGVRLQSRLTSREMLDPLEVLCTRNTHGEWIPAWIGDVPNIPVVNFAVAKCGIENLFTPPPRGVEVRFEDTFDATMFIDQHQKVPIWAGWVTALETLGWVRGTDLFSLAFDWRTGPTSFRAPGATFDRLKTLIEGAVASSGGPVIAVGMSMGAPVLALFLSSGHVSEEWKAAHIEGMVSISGVMGGAVSPLFGLLSGAWAQLIPAVFQSTVLKLVRTMGSIPWLLPAENVFGSNRVVVRNANRTFTTGEVGELLRQAGASHSAQVWEEVRHLSGDSLAPNVSVLCLFGTDVPTLESVEWPGDSFDDPPSNATFATGDGTVLSASLEACPRWGLLQKQPVSVMRYKNISHSELVSQPAVFGEVLKLLGGQLETQDGSSNGRMRRRRRASPAPDVEA